MMATAVLEMGEKFSRESGIFQKPLQRLGLLSGKSRGGTFWGPCDASVMLVS
jgi:hypothetical protein